MIIGEAAGVEFCDVAENLRLTEMSWEINKISHSVRG
jgi:hypothetical protein